MTLVVAILLLMFGLDPATGQMKIKENEKYPHHKRPHNKIDPREKQKIMDLEKKIKKEIKKTAKNTDTLSDEINKVIADPKKKTVLGSNYDLGEKDKPVKNIFDIKNYTTTTDGIYDRELDINTCKKYAEAINYPFKGGDNYRHAKESPGCFTWSSSVYFNNNMSSTGKCNYRTGVLKCVKKIN
jgi:hypothetical protein